MKTPGLKAAEFNLANPPSPEEFGRRVFPSQKPRQRLAAIEDVKPWQLAFFAGWQSFMRQTQKRTEYLPIHPYHAIAAPKLPSQKERDRIPFKVRAPIPIFFSRAVSNSSRRTRIIYAVFALLGLFLIAAAILLASR